MSNSENNKPLEQLKQRLHQFLETLDSLEPESTDLEEIDRLIGMVDELEEKMEQIKADQ